MEVGAVDPRREDASFATGVALNPGRMVLPNCAEGIAMVGPENCEDIPLDRESSDPDGATGELDDEGCSDTSLLISTEV